MNVHLVGPYKVEAENVLYERVLALDPESSSELIRDLSVLPDRLDRAIVVVAAVNAEVAADIAISLAGHH